MRMWEIREKGHRDDDYRGGYRMGMRYKSVDEAYECGYEDGYEDALKEVEMNDRSMRSHHSYEDDHEEGSSFRRRR